MYIQTPVEQWKLANIGNKKFSKIVPIDNCYFVILLSGDPSNFSKQRNICSA